MKKDYQKPEIEFIQLRPEEKLAVCSWPIGYTNNKHGKTCNKPWSDVHKVSSACIAAYNNFASSSS